MRWLQHESMCHDIASKSSGSQSMFSFGLVLQVSLCTIYMCMCLVASNLAGLLASLLNISQERLFSQCEDLKA